MYSILVFIKTTSYGQQPMVYYLNTKDFKTENIRLSRGTGFGFVGMDLIHIAATADGANVATTTIDSVNSPLGNLFVARDDERYATTNVSTISNGETYTVEMSGDPERFVTALTAGDYKYDHVLLVGSSLSYEDEYFHRSLFPVGGVSGSTITLVHANVTVCVRQRSKRSIKAWHTRKQVSKQ